MYGLEDAYVAYCFDEAVSTWGNYVMGELHELSATKADKKASAKQERLLRRLLGMEQKFRAPTPTA